MEIALRMPKIAAPGLAIVTESVAVEHGSRVNPGDRLLDLRIGPWAASFHSELSGVVRDIRAFPGDEVVQDRVLMFVESPEPPPIRSGPLTRADAPAAANGDIPFRLPEGLLRARAPVLVRPLASPGQSIQSGDNLLEFAAGPVHLTWRAPLSGVIDRFLVAPGDDLPEGAAVVRFTGSGVAVSPPAAASGLGALELPEITLPEFRRRAEALRLRIAELAALVGEAGLSNSAGLLQSEADKLAGCRFTVAVVGEFKRGKSTFLNALAGREFLPNDVVPCTAFACRFQYGDRLQLSIVRADGIEVASSADSFPAIAAEIERLTRDPDAGIQEAVIRLPLELCRDGVDLLDTPGLNDSDAMNLVTLAVLPNVDAALLLLIPESPVSDTERRFLEEHLLARDLARLVFVLNAADRVPPPQLGRIANYMEARIRGILAARGAPSISLLPVSSKDELLHPGSPNSGFAALRAELDRLLFRQRGSLLLLGAIQRIRAAAEESVAVLNLGSSRAEVSEESFQAFLQEIERQLAATRLHAISLRRNLLEAQGRAEDAAAERARYLHAALLGLRETLPGALSPESIVRTADEIKAELTAAFAQRAGHLHQQALNLLFQDVRDIYRPMALALREFVENAHVVFVAQIAGRAPLAAAANAPLPAGLEPLDTMRFGGPLGLRVGLSLGAMSWLWLADSVKSFLSGHDLASSIQARALDKLRSNYAQEIERQVRARAGELELQARLAEFARAPFDDLIRRLDQELKVLLDDSLAAVASLRQSLESRDANRGNLPDRILAAAAECEAIAFAPLAPLRCESPTSREH